MKKDIDISRENIRKWLGIPESGTEREIELTEEALILFAEEYSKPAPPGAKERVLQKIRSLSKARENRRPFHLENLPMLDESANWLDWKEAVKNIEPPEDFGPIHVHPLESNEKRDLFVIWVREYVEEEVHHDILESFLILEGSCECHITDVEGKTRVVRMVEGDYIQMQLGEMHDVVITSLHPAKAILQWRKRA